MTKDEIIAIASAELAQEMQELLSPMKIDFDREEMQARIAADMHQMSVTEVN